MLPVAKSINRPTIIVSAEHYSLVTNLPGLAVVKCGATWCKPCVQSAPAYELLAAKYPDVRFYTLDIDDVKDFTDAPLVNTVPMFFMVKNGSPVGALVGVKFDVLEHHIQWNK